MGGGLQVDAVQVPPRPGPTRPDPARADEGDDPQSIDPSGCKAWLWGRCLLIIRQNRPIDGFAVGIDVDGFAVGIDIDGFAVGIVRFVNLQPSSTTLFGVPFPLPTPQGRRFRNKDP